MGTVLSIEVAAPSTESAVALMPKLWAESERLDNIFSRYIPGSEINLINREAGHEPVPVSTDMMTVFTRAGEISRLTGGAFDITVGPLMELWGFFPKIKGKVPPEAEVKKALLRIGWRSVELNPSRQTIRFLLPEMEIDLSAAAKGYVVDRIIALLVEEGIESALVNAGGDIYCLGYAPGGRPWKIGMEHPRNEEDLLTVLELRDRAVATSGDYRNYFIRNRRRYSHIIDPFTGGPVRNGVVGASVLADDCLTADALATAIFVMGAKKGMELIESIEGVEGIIVTEERDEIKMRFSKGSAIKLDEKKLSR